MQNLERVWKAEQKAKEEAEKLEQLQRELEEERRRELLQQHAVEQGIIKFVLIRNLSPCFNVLQKALPKFEIYLDRGEVTKVI